MQEREILFRGKRVDNGEWVTGASILDCTIENEKSVYIISSNSIGKCSTNKYGTINNLKAIMRKIILETRGEYTGLTDKNGVKIFEGDIVHLYGDKSNLDTCSVNYNALVILKDGGFCAIDGTPEDYGLRRYLFAKCDLHCEVIGNIHDNPELIKE